MVTDKPTKCSTCGSSDIEVSSCDYFCRQCKAGTLPHGDPILARYVKQLQPVGLLILMLVGLVTLGESQPVQQQAGFCPVVWMTVPGATKYHLQVATDGQFSSLAFNDSTLIDTTRVVAVRVATTYWWHVRARNSVGWGPWSNARTMATASDATQLTLWYVQGIDSMLRYGITRITSTDSAFWKMFERGIGTNAQRYFAGNYTDAQVDSIRRSGAFIYYVGTKATNGRTPIRGYGQ